MLFTPRWLSGSRKLNNSNSNSNNILKLIWFKAHFYNLDGYTSLFLSSTKDIKRLRNKSMFMTEEMFADELHFPNEFLMHPDQKMSSTMSDILPMQGSETAIWGKFSWLNFYQGSLLALKCAYLSSPWTPWNTFRDPQGSTDPWMKTLTLIGWNSSVRNH